MMLVFVLLRASCLLFSPLISSSIHAHIKFNTVLRVQIRAT